MVKDSAVTNRTRDWSPQTYLWAPTQGKKMDRKGDIFCFETFSESLFADSQFITFVISRLTEFCNFSRLFSLCTKTVSSAKSIVS